MILVLAEKPSAKKNFATALGGTAGRYNGEEYKICALRGHLRGLKDPEEQVPDDYHDEVAEWSTRHLPWDLTRFAWEKCHFDRKMRKNGPKTRKNRSGTRLTAVSWIVSGNPGVSCRIFS